ncbi:hypothetical protein ACQ4PT_057369 [Festuca glaucescens]
MMERYHCGTTSAVNRLRERTTWLRLSICSQGISVSPDFVATLLHFWFEGRTAEFAVREEEAGVFEFRVASPHVAVEIVLKGLWAVGSLRAVINLVSKPTSAACNVALHARHDSEQLDTLYSGATCREMSTPSAHIDQMGRRRSEISGAAGRVASREGVTVLYNGVISHPLAKGKAAVPIPLLSKISTPGNFTTAHQRKDALQSEQQGSKLTIRTSLRSDPGHCHGQSVPGNDVLMPSSQPLPRCVTAQDMQEPHSQAPRAATPNSNPSATSSNALPPPPPSYKDVLLRPSLTPILRMSSTRPHLHQPINLHRRCFRCLEYNHRAYRCTNSVVCRFCRRSGHKRSMCPSLLRLRQQAPAACKEMEPVFHGLPTSLDIHCPPVQDPHALACLIDVQPPRHNPIPWLRRVFHQRLGNPAVRFASSSSGSCYAMFLRRHDHLFALEQSPLRVRDIDDTLVLVHIRPHDEGDGSFTFSYRYIACLTLEKFPLDLWERHGIKIAVSGFATLMSVEHGAVRSHDYSALLIMVKVESPLPTPHPSPHSLPQARGAWQLRRRFHQ